MYFPFVLLIYCTALLYNNKSKQVELVFTWFVAVVLSGSGCDALVGGWHLRTAVHGRLTLGSRRRRSLGVVGSRRRRDWLHSTATGRSLRF